MTFEEFEKADKATLRAEAKACFDNVANMLHEPERRTMKLLEAQFYMQEMDRRHDSWISIRDFLLEVIVIGLIGWEIWMGYRADHNQTKNFDAEQKVLANMDKSSAATAASLTAAQTSLENMNQALQKQLSLFYDVSVIMMYEADKHELRLMNNGRTNVSIWGLDVGEQPMTTDNEGRALSPDSGYSLDGSALYNFVAKKFPMPMDGLVPFRLYVKNERKEEFVVNGYFAMHWVDSVGHLNVQISSTVPENWSRARKPK